MDGSELWKIMVHFWYTFGTLVVKVYLQWYTLGTLLVHFWYTFCKSVPTMVHFGYTFGTLLVHFCKRPFKTRVLGILIIINVLRPSLLMSSYHLAAQIGSIQA